MEYLIIGSAVTAGVMLFFYLRSQSQAKRFNDLAGPDERSRT